jgi:hypothetical protein
VRKVWFSMFTPQKGALSPEILTWDERKRAVTELLRLQTLYPKLDMVSGAIREFLHPPSSPGECIFARTTEIISADLKTKVSPCQYGGNPDCSQCGCVASVGMAALGHHKLGGLVQVGSIYNASLAVGRVVQKLRGAPSGPEPPDSPSRAPIVQDPKPNRAA